MERQELLRPEDAARILQISSGTLIKWSNQGTIKYTRTKGGHRRYFRSDLYPEQKQKEEQTKENRDNRRSICYCRVSTRGQKEDLERQKQFFRQQYPNYELIYDYGSGINFKRKGLETILDAAIRGDIKEVVVTYKDRLCRFGFELIQRIIEKYSNGKIVVLNQGKTSPETELVNDLISIITVFSSRIYGLRSNEIKRKIHQQIQEAKTGIKPKNSEDEDFPNSE